MQNRKNDFVFDVTKNPELINANPEGLLLSDIKQDKTPEQLYLQYTTAKDLYSKYTAIEEVKTKFLKIHLQTNYICSSFER